VTSRDPEWPDLEQASPVAPRAPFPSSDVASACCKCMFQVFQMFNMQVASASCGCYICCNGYTRMLQASVPNVSAVSD
jgi:hypothetical protein